MKELGKVTPKGCAKFYKQSNDYMGACKAVRREQMHLPGF